MPIIIESLRPRQWIKNLFIFAPLIFAQKIFDLQLLFISLFTFIIFCLLSSSGYLIIAAGKLSPSTAVALALSFAIAALILSASVNLPLLCVAATYNIIMACYSIALKNILIVDVLTISLGFVLRVIAGCVAIEVEISPWLFMCMLFLALFLALAKRKTELRCLGDAAARHRPLFTAYTGEYLQGLLHAVVGCILLSYSLYTISARTIERLHTKNLIFTIPFVIYGVFRYLHLIISSDKSAEELLTQDKPLLMNVVLWAASVVAILYFAQ